MKRGGVPMSRGWKQKLADVPRAEPQLRLPATGLSRGTLASGLSWAGGELGMQFVYRREGDEYLVWRVK